MQLPIPTPSVAGLLDRPTVAARVAELDRSFDMHMDALAGLTAAKADGDMTAIVTATNGLNTLTAGTEVGVNRLAHALNTEIKRAVKGATK